MKCIIVDIDGTLADCSHRRKFLEVTPKNWEKFSDPEEVKKDRPIAPIITVVNALLSQTGAEIVFASGRTENLRSTTVTWLRKWGLWFFPFKLYMRKDGDYRPDTEVKKEILEQIKAEGFEPWLSIDDRSSVVKMWREEGLTCLQVAEGNF